MYLCLVIFSLVLTGCTNRFLCIKMGDCAPWYTELLEEYSIGWNAWLGKSKDQRIKEFGLPDNCMKLESGEEVCEWKVSGLSGSGSYYRGTGTSQISSYEHRLAYTYDRDHIARVWNYRGELGQANSLGNLGPRRQ